MATDNSKVEIQVPGVDFAQMAREAIAGQLTAAMVASPAMIQKIVAAALTQKVDSEGHARNGYGGDKSYVEWVCENMIREAVVDLMGKELERMRPDLEKAVVTEIRRSAPTIAKALVKSYGENVGHNWSTKVEFHVQPGRF